MLTMDATDLSLSLVIVTYNRNQVLIETISYLLKQAEICPEYLELLIIDQTDQHDEVTQQALAVWNSEHKIRWIRLPQPDLTGAMNRGLLEAKGTIVLYTDDDIIPDPNLLVNHLNAYRYHPEASAVVGQILQPGEQPENLSYTPKGSYLRRYMDFPFRSTMGCYIENAMAGNLSLVKVQAIKVGGFDENFRPPVASRFESEFAKRLVKAGGKIWFEPSASIYHLAVKTGGTRSKGSHLNSMSPRYGVGDYYFALRHGTGWDRLYYMLKRLFREIRTRYHLRHPWFIPIKFIGELRAIFQAWRLYHQQPELLRRNDS